jgi:FixJ family two-component response regulator
MKTPIRKDEKMRKIAVVDDCEVVRMAWEFNSTELEVSCYSNPEAFLDEKSKLNGYDCIIIDYDYGEESEMTGLDLGQEIRKNYSGKLILSTGFPEIGNPDLFDAIIGKEVKTAEELQRL